MRESIGHSRTTDTLNGRVLGKKASGHDGRDCLRALSMRPAEGSTKWSASDEHDHAQGALSRRPIFTPQMNTFEKIRVPRINCFQNLFSA
jgi:hypothetical protein